MAHEISQQNIDGINRHLTDTGWVAKRGLLNSNEIIVGKQAETAGCLTIILADDPNNQQRPTWYIGIFTDTSPREVSREIELLETPRLLKEVYWHPMLQTLYSEIKSM